MSGPQHPSVPARDFPKHVSALHADGDIGFRQPSVKPTKPPPNLAEGIESAFLNIEFSGIVDSDDESGTRSVVQYHYTVWPDHGTPRHPLAVLPFVSAAAQHPSTVLTEEQYVFVHDALLEHVRSGNTEVEFPKAREYLVKLLEPISDDELVVLDLNSNKHKSVHDLTNGIENGETSSMKSSQSNHNSDKEIVENGSEISIKTDELNSEQSKSSTRESKSSARESKSSARESNETSEEQKEGLTNGDDSEGVYDLAPRSTDTYSKKMQAYNNMSEQEKEEIRRLDSEVFWPTEEEKELFVANFRASFVSKDTYVAYRKSDRNPAENT
ncbi:putative receptor protein tyrosine phosphatase, partial [Operophtera brumata]